MATATTLKPMRRTDCSAMCEADDQTLVMEIARVFRQASSASGPPSEP